MPGQQNNQPQPRPPDQLAEIGTPPSPDHCDTPTYRIRVKGQLHPRWSTWFDHLTITLDESGDTLLSGPVVDQAALHGILTKIRDLGLPLVSVMEIDHPAEAHGSADTLSYKETNS